MTGRAGVVGGAGKGSRRGRKPPVLAPFVKRGDALEGVREPEMARLNGDCYRAVVADSISRVRRWEAEMARVEWLMAEVGRGMRSLQPNRPGRLIVRWWKLRGDDQWRTPLLLRVVADGGVVTLKPMEPGVKPLGTGYFKTARTEVVGLVRVWWRLVEIRDWLVAGLAGVGRARPGRRIEVFEVVEALAGEVDELVSLGRRKIELMRGDAAAEWEAEDEGELEVAG